MKNLSKEECEKKMKIAFEKKGIDYQRYIIEIENRKELKRERSMGIQYKPNHEDNIQFGCCCSDTTSWF